MNYDSNEHAHRFAVWAASTAGRASIKCRFTVAQGKAMMESNGFTSSLQVPIQAEFDHWHRGQRQRFIGSGQIKNMTHGVAGKLIDVYLKARYLGSLKREEFSSDYFHPPLDDILIKGIKFGMKIGDLPRLALPKNKAWSTFSSEDYESWIKIVSKLVQVDQPLWMIETHWRGHQ